ncbi:MAG: acetylglutamate kinase [Chitinispirillaceae bacterium]|nr:acetylglutamate kinase [Chitinispirillaceae bacterium]
MRIFCLKVGGSSIDEENFLPELGLSIKKVIDSIFPVIVHGGGKDITKQLKLLNREFSFVDGMRVTDAEVLRVVEMVLSGDVNKRIVNALLNSGVTAAGFSGVDASLFTASKLLLDGKDIGFVGKIEKVSTLLIDICKEKKIVPVISPISRGVDGTLYNVNADPAASELAIAMKADDLIFISDIPGVIIDNNVRREIKIFEIEKLIKEGHITGGMIPKLRSAADAIKRGVKRIHICNWKGIETLENILKNSVEAGTVISE